MCANKNIRIHKPHKLYKIHYVCKQEHRFKCVFLITLLHTKQPSQINYPITYCYTKHTPQINYPTTYCYTKHTPQINPRCYFILLFLQKHCFFLKPYYYGPFSEAGLHKSMPFVIFRTRSHERSRCHFWANF